MEPLHISLFSGIGGIDLAAEWAGFRTVAMCEKDVFCRRVLGKHWPNVPIVEDVHDFDGTIYTGEIAVLSGGFPCQPYSAIGQRRGTDDHRALWPQMLRIVREVRPAWVLGENVAGFIGMGLDDAAADLEAAGYEVEPIVLPLGAVGGDHIRERCFILAHAKGVQFRGEPPTGIDAAGRAGARPLSEQFALLAEANHPTRAPRIWSAERGLGRVADGVPGRMDRLRSLGNAVSPQHVYPILREIRRLIG